MNLDEEIIDGYLVSTDMKKLWSIEMDLAARLLEVCKRHGLKIWAEGGTLLGAVRHKGFIPWDDDMDFVMFREDFEILKQIGPSEFYEPYFFQSMETDDIEGYAVRIRHSDTTMISWTDPLHVDRNYGIFIDVFVQDAIPSNKKVLGRSYNKIRFLNRLISNDLYLDARHSSITTRIVHSCIRMLFRIVDVKKAQERTEVLLKKNQKTKHDEVGLVSFYAALQADISKLQSRKIAWFRDTVFLPFHEMMLPAPIDYDAVLRSHYGDYMVPVKGGAFHTIRVMDCDRPYKEVIEDLRIKNNL